MEFLKFATLSLQITGLHSINSDNRVLYQLHKTYRVFFIVLFADYLVSLYIEVFVNRDGEIFEIINNLTVTLLFTVTAFKVVECLSDLSKGLMKHIYETEHEIMSENDETIKKIHLHHADWSLKVNITFTLLACGTLVFFLSAPLFVDEVHYANARKNNLTDDDYERQFAVVVWTPFNKHIHYILGTIYIWIFGSSGALITMSTDCYMWALIIFGINQIKILQYKLKSLEEHSKVFAQENDVPLEVGFIHTLRKCIILHQGIIQYVVDLNKLMSKVLLIDFAIASLQIAALGLEVMFIDFGLKQMVAVVFLMAMMFQLFMFYWHGNEVTLEAMAVSAAIWESNFYTYSKRIQGDLRLMIMRSQRPLVLKVGPFYNLSNETAVIMIKASYSYVALISQIFKDV